MDDNNEYILESIVKVEPYTTNYNSDPSIGSDDVPLMQRQLSDGITSKRRSSNEMLNGSTSKMKRLGDFLTTEIKMEISDEEERESIENITLTPSQEGANLNKSKTDLDNSQIESMEQIAAGNYTYSLRRKAKSPIWNLFNVILRPDGTVVPGIVCCRSCSKLLKYSQPQTSNLHRHKCCIKIKDAQTLTCVNALDKNEAIEKCTSWIIEDCRPFSAIQDAGFVSLVKFFIKIGANYGENIDIDDLLPNETTISRKIEENADEKKNELKEELNSIVNSRGATAIIHRWRDNYIKRNCLGVILHYKKNSRIIDLVLGIKSMDFERSTEECIMEKLISLFNEFGIENIDPIKFVIQKEENIDKALKNHILINCSTHLFTNVLDNSFAETTELFDILEACEQIVKYFQKSKTQDLHPILLQKQSSSKWYSHYAMFKFILDNSLTIGKLIALGKLLVNINLSTLKILVELCKDFEVVFKKLQSYSSPSLCYVIPSIIKMKNVCASNIEDIPVVSSLKKRIIQNIDKIWIDNLSLWHRVACFLHPPAKDIQPNHTRAIKSFCTSLIKEMKSLTSHSKTNSAASTSQESCSASTSKPMSQNNDALFFFSHLIKHSSKNTETPEEGEVDSYSREVVKLTPTFDVIEWWKDNTKKYPYLSKLAMEVHTIPASGTVAERVFSSGFNLTSENGNSLMSTSVSNAFFLNSYYKNFHNYNDSLRNM